MSFRDIHSSVGAAVSYTNSRSHKPLKRQARRGIARDEAKVGGVREDGGLELVMPDHEGLDACGDVVSFCHKLLVFNELGRAFQGSGPSPRPRGGRF